MKEPSRAFNTYNANICTNTAHISYFDSFALVVEQPFNSCHVYRFRASVFAFCHVVFLERAIISTKAP